MTRSLRRVLLGLAGAALLTPLPLVHGSVTGQWDFKRGDLSATIGQPMSSLDIDTQTGTHFGTTASFGVPAIGGQSVAVMQFPATTSPSGGFDVFTGAASNGGGALINQWTVIMDVYYPPASDGVMRSLIHRSDLTGNPEFYINSSDQVGFDTGAFSGAVTTNGWHRIVFSVDTATTISTYLDGVKVDEENTPGGLDGRFALGQDFFLFNGDTNQTALGYIASLQFRDEKLSDGLVATLGAPSPTGILSGPPPNPYTVSVSPSPDTARFPGRSSVSPLPTVAIVLADGQASVVTNSIQLTVDNAAVAPLISRTNGTTTITFTFTNLQAPLSLHAVSLAYKDNAVPADALGVQWQFVVGAYTALPSAAALPLSAATTPGFLFRLVQAPDTDQNNIDNLFSTYARAIQQLDGTLLDTNGVAFTNSAPAGPNPDGSFFIDVYNPSDVICFNLTAAPLIKFPNFPVVEWPGMPGTDPNTGQPNTDNFADETLAYLALTAGPHTFGVDVAIERVDYGFGGDNGYRLYCGANPRDQFATLVGQFQRTGDNFNDRENTNEFTFVAPVTGLYPFRLVHWKNFSGATLAWYSVDTATGDRILINDGTDPRAVKAYRATSVPREPYVAEATPSPGAEGVAATTPFTIVLGNDGLAVKPSSIQLLLDGAPVTPTLTQNGNLTTVLYNPNATRTTVTNTLELIYSDNGSPATFFTNQWSFTIVVAGAPEAAVTGQWDFNGNLAATVGKDLEYLDGPSGQSVANTSFGTTASFGIPSLNGVSTTVMLRKGTISQNIGYIMDHQIPPNGGGQLVNQYTIIFDVFKKSGTTTLFNCQSTNNTTDGSIFWQNNDIGQGAGGYVDKGTATPGAWHRIALAADMGANPPVITKFVDGIKQQDWVQPGLDLPRRSWQHTVLLFADGDGDDMTDTYVRCVQVSAVKLSDAELVALGGPSADGIPVATPPTTVTGQWDFQGDLTATAGKDLQYLDGASGQSVANTTFGTTTSFGIPDINGTPTKIMLRKGTISQNIGYVMDHQIPPNGGGQLVNQYTIIFDVFKKSGTTTLFNCQSTNNTTDGSIFWQNNDIGQGAGGYVDLGTATSGAWHRIALAADMGANPPVITKFVDGIKQQDWVQPGKDLPRRSWQPTVLLFADGDGDDMTDTYVSSVQVSSTKLSDAALVALGGPSADKIPVVVPFPSALPPVALSLSRNGVNLVLSWSAAGSAFTLQSTGDLTHPAWAPVPGVTTNSVLITPTAARQFYRLVR